MSRPSRLFSLAALLTPFWISQGASYPQGPGAVAQGFDYPDGTTDLADGSRIASDQSATLGFPVAGVFNNTLRLTERNTTNVIGSFRLPDLDPGSVARSLDLKFNILMNPPPDGQASEGWSVNFGHLPDDNGTGEGGFVPLPRGLTIAFNTGDNPEHPPSIQISVGGVIVGNFPKTFVFDGNQRPVTIHWDAAGLDIGFENHVVCTDLPIPGFAPPVGGVFGFTARSSRTSMEVAIASLRAVTQSLPAIDTGGPIIDEFVANNSLLEDEYAAKPGWIEIYNGSGDVVDMTGWYLTDSKNNLTRWKIQGLSLNPYNYQVIYASGRDLQRSSSNLIHTSFILNKHSGYLALVKPDGTTLATAYTYGEQDKDVAYGEMGSNRIVGYMFPPSPGTVNTQEPSTASFSPEVAFSHPGGFTSAPLDLVLSAENQPGLEIRYTLDRTEPGRKSLQYSNPIPLVGFTTVKARTYSTGHLPGPVTSHTYVFMDGTLTNYAGTGKEFNSNLPFLFVDSFGAAIDDSNGGSQPFRPCYLLAIRPDSGTARATLSTPPEYAGPCGVHVRGESSAGFDQRSYSLEVWDESGRDRAASLAGMPADSDWVLYGPWSEKTMMRNKLIFDWMRGLRGADGSAVRSEFVELFFNQSKPLAGKVSYSSYRGIYVLMEKLKRGKNRVPIANLNDKTVAPDLITGGYIIRTDKADAQKNNWLSGSSGIPFQSYDPDRLNAVQFNYIKKYTTTVQSTLDGGGLRNPRTGYAAYLDPDTFIDAQWLLEVSKQVDGYVFSTYFTKDRSGRLRAGPLWDFNIALGNADYGSGETSSGWLYDVPNGVGQLWYPRLHSDPEYRQAHWDRYWQMRRTLLSTESAMAVIDRHMATLLDGYSGLVSNRAPVEIQNPVARHFRKWPRLGVRDWPNPPATTKIKTWQAEVEYMKNWLKTRLEWLDEQSLRNGKVVFRPPVLSHSGGAIGAPVSLTMSPFVGKATNALYPNGTIYFTLDNSDPRLPGGAINPDAAEFRKPISIESSMTVNARLFAQNQWTPLATASFYMNAKPASAANLVIAEVLYQPMPLLPDERVAGVVDSENFEFVELMNRAPYTLDLTGVQFSGGIDFEFDATTASARLLRAGESVVVVADRRAFQLRNPRLPAAKIVGQFRGHLNNGGETLTLTAGDGQIIQEFRFNDKAPWPAAWTGEGYSLIRRDTLKNLDPTNPDNWILSAKPGGTPGVSGTGADRFSGNPTADSDSDGLSDLLEFFAGSDALNPNSANRPQAAVTALRVLGVDSLYLTYSLRRGPGVLGLNYAIESSPDLKSWRPAAADFILHESRENPDGTVTELYRGTTPWSSVVEEAQFLRLRVNTL